MTTERQRVDALRRKCRRIGCAVWKARGARYSDAPFFVIEPDRYFIVVGEMTLEQAETWIADEMAAEHDR